MSQQGGRQELQKSLNMKDVLALAFGTMIGWGWIMLAGSWVGNGGTVGAILAFLLGGFMAMFVGLTYAELGKVLHFLMHWASYLKDCFRSWGYYMNCRVLRLLECSCSSAVWAL